MKTTQTSTTDRDLTKVVFVYFSSGSLFNKVNLFNVFDLIDFRQHTLCSLDTELSLVTIVKLSILYLVS